MTGPKTKAELKPWLSRKLKLAGPRFDVIWKDLQRSRDIESTQIDEEDDLEYLVKQARRFLKVSDGLRSADRRRGRSKDPQPAEFLTDVEKRRAQAFALYLARLAEAHAEVRQFRADFLQSSVLGRDQAIAFVNSVANQRVAAQRLRNAAVPFVGHESELLGDGVSGEMGGRPPDAAKVRVRWDNRSQDFDLPSSPPGGSSGRDWDDLPFSPETVGFVPSASVPVWPDSPLSSAKIVVTQLINRYPWNPGPTTWFLLTGEPPQVPPFKRSGRRRMGNSDPGEPITVPSYVHERVIFEISPWVSVRTLAHYYRVIQTAHNRSDNRMPSEKVLELFIFIEQMRRQLDKLPSWTEVLRKWNLSLGTKPGWRYESRSSIRAAYTRALEQIARGSFGR